MTRPLAPIGLYDSGLGGLTVVREFLRQLPGEAFLYLGDTARLPYGGRSADELVTFNREIVAYLASEGAKAILVACNTSCATALDAVRAESPVPVVGLIDAGARQAARHGRRVAVLATEATIRSGAYVRALEAQDDAIEVVPLACPHLVPAIESGIWEGSEAEAIVRAELAPVAGLDLDAVILGCTHFPLLARAIQGVLGPRVALVDPAVEAVRELAGLLAGAGQLADGSGEAAHDFIVTGDPESFAAQASLLLGQDVGQVSRVFLQTLELAGGRLIGAEPTPVAAADPEGRLDPASISAA